MYLDFFYRLVLKNIYKKVPNFFRVQSINIDDIYKVLYLVDYTILEYKLGRLMRFT